MKHEVWGSSDSYSWCVCVCWGAGMAEEVGRGRLTGVLRGGGWVVVVVVGFGEDREQL